MFDPDRQFANPAAGGMEHRVGDGCGGAYHADFSDAFDPERVDDLVPHFHELHLDIWGVGMDRDEVVAQARVGPPALPGGIIGSADDLL
jgi:hypothetical protein